MDKQKEKTAIERLRAFVPEDGDPYWVAYSGGKDSDCIRILAELADVPHELHHNLTTVDAPETVRYVKSVPGVQTAENMRGSTTMISMHGLRSKTTYSFLSIPCRMHSSRWQASKKRCCQPQTVQAARSQNDCSQTKGRMTDTVVSVATGNYHYSDFSGVWFWQKSD